MSVTTTGDSAITPGLSVTDPNSECPGGYQVTGLRYPVISKMLAPGESIRGEPGSMLTMDNEVSMSTGLSRSGLIGVATSFMGGDILVNTYKNKSSSKPQMVSLAGNMPFGYLMPVNLSEAGKLNAKTGAYFAGDKNITISSKFLRAQSCAGFCCGGMPPVMQRLSGDGVAFLLGSGTVIRKKLENGEKIVVSTDSLLAFTNTVKYDVKCTGSCQTWCFGGEGCYNTTLEGPGEVYLQSFSTEKLRRLVMSMTMFSGKKGSKSDGVSAAAGALGGAPETEETDLQEDAQPSVEAEEMQR